MKLADFARLGYVNETKPIADLFGMDDTLPRSRIAIGRDAPKGSHPWVASVRLKSTGNGQTQDSVHKCGGVILNEFNILSASHCFQSYPYDRFEVRVGDWDMEVQPYFFFFNT